MGTCRALAAVFDTREPGAERGFSVATFQEPGIGRSMRSPGRG